MHQLWSIINATQYITTQIILHLHPYIETKMNLKFVQIEFVEF